MMMRSNTIADLHESDVVILLHGLSRNKKSMQSLARFLYEKGAYSIINIGYPSTHCSIAILTDRIQQELSRRLVNSEATVHIVTHSMGSLITRLLIEKYPPKNLGRVVMLAPPNQGSRVADFLKRRFNLIYKPIWGPAGQELGKDTDSIIHRLAPIDFELGVIAGDRSINPIGSIINQGKDDGTVAVEETRIDGMKDHIVIHATHSFIMKNKEAMKQVLHFLQSGRFKRE